MHFDPYPVVLEPIVNREKLAELLKLGTEYPCLDFKENWDLKKTEDEVDMTRHVGAMEVLGAYIVVGVDGNGVPTSALTAAQAKLFDEAALRPKLLKRLPEPLQIASQVHEMDDGKLVALIYIAPHPDGCVFFEKGGTYEKQLSNGKKQAVTVFRKGEVYYRKGTASVPLDQEGLRGIIQRRVEQEKEGLREEAARNLAEALERQANIQAGASLARAPAETLNMTLPTSILRPAVIELLRDKDEIPLRLLLSETLGRARQALASPDWQEPMTELLDGLTAFATVCLETGSEKWFHRALDVLVAIYEEMLDEQGFSEYPARLPTDLKGPALWLMIVVRMEALGGLAVRMREWDAVRAIAARNSEHAHHSYVSWLRHGLTMASRAGHLEDPQNRSQISLMSLSRLYAEEHPWIRPELPEGDERLLNSILQFDLLACLVAADLNGSPDASAFYTNFARYFAHRVDPVAKALLRNQSMREAIFHGDDAHLAHALFEVNRMARSEHFATGFDGFGDDVWKWVMEHLPPEALNNP
jgi:hypothetical protein